MDRSPHLPAASHRILTTHVGSLPRSAAVAALLTARENAQPFAPEEFERVMSAAVADVVRQQADTGIDLVSDGETAKISYATYVHERLSGFAGDNARQVALDLKDYPDFRARMAVFAGKQGFRRASCVGAIRYVGQQDLARDIANLQAAIRGTPVAGAFLNAASPGVVSAFQPNAWYPSHAAYVEAIGEAMRTEYEAIVGAGFMLQLDCPDLAMARHTGFQDLDEAAFLHRAARHVEALNVAVANIPATAMRMHLCWGNYEGPHDCDIDLAKVIGIVLRAKPHAISFEAANPRHEHEWIVWRDAKIPGDKVLIPGVLDTCTNYVEHPELVAQRIERYAEIVGRERVLAGTDCGFGTFAGYGKVDPDVAAKKLAAMVEGARLASARLYR